MSPLLRKDLLAILRQKRIAAAHTLFVAVLGATVLMTWPQQGIVAVASRAQDNLLIGILVGQASLFALLVPAIAAVLLTSEWEAGTFELLYASRLTAPQIVLGKVGSCLGFPAVLLISGLPFMGLLSWRGAVNLEHVAIGYAILILSALLLAMISLAVSSCCRQSMTALVVSYLIALSLSGGALVPAALMLDSESGPVAEALHYARGLSPIAAMLSLVCPNPGDFDGVRHQLAPLWQIFIPLSLFVILVCFAVVAGRLARSPVSLFGTDKSSLPSRGRSRVRRLLFIIDPSKPHKPIGRVNPILAKEIRTNLLQSGRWMIRIFCTALCLSMTLALMSLLSGTASPDLLGYVVSVLVSFQFGLVAMVVPSITSAAVSGEFENKTFDTLRLTPLSGGRIFWGKLLPALPPALLPVAALAPAYAILCLVDPGYWPFVLRLAPIVGLAVIFCAAIGLTCSSFTQTTGRAAAVSYLVTATLFLLPVLPWWAAGTQLQEHFAAWLAMPSPLVMGLKSVTMRESTQGLPALWTAHVSLIGCMCLLLFVVARMRLSQLLRQR